MEKHELEKLIKLLKEKKLSLAMAESITAGLAMGELANVPGISDVLLGGIISYKRETKEEILDVSSALIDEKSAESQEVTTAMAQGLKNIFKSGITVAVTGAASEPAKESAYKLKVPVGTIFITLIYNGQIIEKETWFNGNPDEIRKKTVDFIYREILNLVENPYAE